MAFVHQRVDEFFFLPHIKITLRYKDSVMAKANMAIKQIALCVVKQD